MWKYLLLYLVSDYRVLLYDLMGVGSINFKDFSFSWYLFFYVYVDDLFVILDELEIESCIFVGVFVFGMIGCFVLIEWLEVFMKLILLVLFLRYLICYLYRFFVFCVNFLNLLMVLNVVSLIYFYKNILWLFYIVFYFWVEFCRL